MEICKIRKKFGFWKTLYKTHEEEVEDWLIVLCSLHGAATFMVFCAAKEGTFYHNIAICNLIIYSLILAGTLIYFAAKSVLFTVKKLQRFQRMPITKEEFETMGIKTQEDVLCFLMFYLYLGPDRCVNTYPEYLIEPMTQVIHSFPRNLDDYTENQNLHDYYQRRTLMDFRNKNEDKRALLDRDFYLTLKPGVSKALIPEFDKLSNLYFGNRTVRTQ